MMRESICIKLGTIVCVSSTTLYVYDTTDRIYKTLYKVFHLFVIFLFTYIASKYWLLIQKVIMTFGCDLSSIALPVLREVIR